MKEQIIPELPALLQLRLPVEITIDCRPTHATLVPQILTELTSRADGHSQRWKHLDVHLVNQSGASPYSG